jgi:hypothetical protein
VAVPMADLYFYWTGLVVGVQGSIYKLHTPDGCPCPSPCFGIFKKVYSVHLHENVWHPVLLMSVNIILHAVSFI